MNRLPPEKRKLAMIGPFVAIAVSLAIVFGLFS